MSCPTFSFLPWKSLATCLILLIMELQEYDFLMVVFIRDQSFFNVIAISQDRVPTWKGHETLL
jgi:hypothetical protein